MSTVWEFPSGTWVENLAIRQNGQILVTLLNLPDIYQVDPTLATPATLVYSFENYLSVAGITELGSDIFYAVVGNFSTAAITTGPGSYSVWRIDLNGFVPGGKSPPATLIADFPESIFFNGMTSLCPTSDLLLIADSRGGDIWSVNVNTGDIEIVTTDTLMEPEATGEDIGINGVKVKNGAVYFTNTDQSLLGKVPIESNGAVTGSASTVVASLVGADDFVFDAAGDVLFAGDDELRFTAIGTSTFTTLSNDTLLEGSTAVQFASDSSTVYVTTNGGAAQFETKEFTNPGKVVQLLL